jgi:putative membrane protein
MIGGWRLGGDDQAQPRASDPFQGPHGCEAVGTLPTTQGYTEPMLWVKSFHIVFVASWFAGLFYLPRIFVNLAMVAPESVAERERLLLMSRKLMRFTTLLAVPAVGLGLWLWLGYGIGLGAGNGWMHAKLVIVVLVLAYHQTCRVMLRRFERGLNRRGHVWYRWFNEAPVILLVIAVVLVVVKPF